MSTFSEKHRKLCMERFKKLMTLYVGRGCPFDYEELERESHGVITTRAAKGWDWSDSLPQFPAFLMLCKILGPEFTNGIMELAGYKVVPLSDEELKPQTPAEALQESLERALVIVKHSHIKPDHRYIEKVNDTIAGIH